MRCRKEYFRQRYQDNKEKITEYSRQYRQDNKERVAETRKQHYQDNKEEIKEQVKKYYQDNKEKKKEYQQAHRAEKNEYIKNRCKTDPVYALRNNVSSQIWNALKRNVGSKKGESVMKYLPYTIAALKEHIERQFEPWMTWDNHGEWHIHHIKPHSKLPYKSMNDTNFHICWALENLMPLEAKENQRLGNREKM